jgi:hypothetical protein
VSRGFWLSGPEGGDNWEVLGIGGKIKMDLREKGIDGANWMWLAQYRVQWQVFVNMVMNPQVP